MIRLAFAPTRCPVLLVFPFVFISRQHASRAKVTTELPMHTFPLDLVVYFAFGHALTLYRLPCY